MAVRFIEGVDPTSSLTIAQILANLKNQVGPHQVPFVFDQDTGLVHYYDKVNSAARTVANLDQAQTLTNKTLTAPTISAPVVTGNPTGTIKVAGGVITELTGDGAYSISVTIPAGAVVIDFIITAEALWDSATSATLIVGDTADPDGFFTAVNAKTTPAVGTSLRPDTVPGGTGDGAYLGDTNGEFVGPATANFGRYYKAGSIITATITKSGAGTAGRTWFHVVYVLPEVVTQVVV